MPINASEYIQLIASRRSHGGRHVEMAAADSRASNSYS